MAGVSSFFRSDRYSDTTLVLMLDHSTPLESGTQQLSSASPNSSTGVQRDVLSSRSSKSHTTCRFMQAKEQGKQENEVACIPAHRIILESKSSYFCTRLSTAVGDKSTAVIREHAASVEEVQAMESVLEFMYTNQLPLYCTQYPLSSLQGHPVALVQRLLQTLMIADYWQVRTCMSECCTAICSQLPTSVTWEDCYAIYSMPQQLQEHIDVSTVMDFAMATVINLCKQSLPTLQQTAPQVLCAQLQKLPSDVRLMLLKGCKLGFAGVLALLMSDEQVADSEDSLTMFLAKYLDEEVGQACTISEIKELRNQLQYQHMSNFFHAFNLPLIPRLSLDVHQFQQLTYLRGLKGSTCIPLYHRQPNVPAAWYEPARKQTTVLPDTFDLEFDLSEAALADHLDAVIQFKAGGPVPLIVLSGPVEFRWASWRLSLQSPTLEQQLYVGVQAMFEQSFMRSSPASLTAGIYAEITYRMESADPVITAQGTSWVGQRAVGYSLLAKEFGKLPGDPLDLSWWKGYIKDGKVRFSATVKIL